MSSLPTGDHWAFEDEALNLNMLRAIRRAWHGRKRIKAGEFARTQEVAEGIGVAERYVS